MNTSKNALSLRLPAMLLATVMLLLAATAQALSPATSHAQAACPLPARLQVGDAVEVIDGTANLLRQGPGLAGLSVADIVRAEETLIADIYERASPAVVHIATQVTEMSFFFGPVPREGTAQFLRHCERHEEVIHRQQPRLLPRRPRGRVRAAATRTGPVMTTVVTERGLRAVPAAIHVPAQLRRPAPPDRRERASLRRGRP